MPRIKQNSPEREVDAIIGQRVRVRRLELSMTQGDLGAEIGLSYQQVQKFELGKDRMAVSQMLDIAEALNVDPCYFIKDLGSSKEMPFLSKDQLKLIMAYSSVSNASVKEHVLKTVLSLMKAATS